MSRIRTYKLILLLIVSLVVLLVSNCSSYEKVFFNYLDSYEIQPNLEFQETKMGGLSGIDYKAESNTYYLVSDDRSENSPARFYIADINIYNNTIGSVDFFKSVLFTDRKNELLKEQTSDFESLRYNPRQKVLFLADEGGEKGNAAIKIIDTIGHYISDFKLDAPYLKKIRPNKSFESISFSKDYKSVFYATEAPLVGDGDIPTIDYGGLIRIIESNIDGVVKKQFLYELEKVHYGATGNPPWEGTGSDNGLSEILSIGKNKFLTLERSGAYQEDGTFKFTCKVFFVKGKKKGNNNDLRTYQTVKKEVFDFSKLPDGKFNIEGMTLGPIINNKQYIVFVSDNNFKDTIPTMIYLFVITYK